MHTLCIIMRFLNCLEVALIIKNVHILVYHVDILLVVHF